jgi:hypothetical protein
MASPVASAAQLAGEAGGTSARNDAVASLPPSLPRVDCHELASANSLSFSTGECPNAPSTRSSRSRLSSGETDA